MVEATIQQMIKMLDNLKKFLDKTQEYADAKKCDVSNILQSRLAPDQFNLIRQVQIACDTAKFCAAKLSNKPAPSFEDKESTLAELKTRISKTQEFLQQFKKDDFKGWETVRTTNQRVEGKYLPGDEFLTQYSIPNFYFHTVTAYSIMRHNGVDLGKMDYLSPLNFRDL